MLRPRGSNAAARVDSLHSGSSSPSAARRHYSLTRIPGSGNCYVALKAPRYTVDVVLVLLDVETVNFLRSICNWTSKNSRIVVTSGCDQIRSWT